MMTLGVVLYLMKYVLDKDFNNELAKVGVYLAKIRDQKMPIDLLE